MFWIIEMFANTEECHFVCLADTTVRKEEKACSLSNPPFWSSSFNNSTEQPPYQQWTNQSLRLVNTYLIMEHYNPKRRIIYTLNFLSILNSEVNCNYFLGKRF